MSGKVRTDNTAALLRSAGFVPEIFNGGRMWRIGGVGALYSRRAAMRKVREQLLREYDLLKGRRSDAIQPELFPGA